MDADNFDNLVKNPDVKQVRKTLDRLPDDITLAIGSRDIEPDNYNTCIAGWSLREALARVLNRAADEVLKWNDPNYQPGTDTPTMCARYFGGTRLEWSANVYNGIIFYPEIVETALVDRIMTAVSRAEK